MLVYFSVTMFANLNYGPLLSGILAGVLNTVFAVASYPPIWYIERVGRRAMMIWSALGCGLCMLVYVIVTTLPAGKQSSATNWVAVAFIILYEVVFAFGWLGTCWIYGPEIAPLKYRHVAGSLGAAGEWFSTWVMVFGGGSGINAVGPKIFVWPLICCFLAAAYVYWLCPESKSFATYPLATREHQLTCTSPQQLARPSKKSMLFSPVRPRCASVWSARSEKGAASTAPSAGLLVVAPRRCLPTAEEIRMRRSERRRSPRRYRACGWLGHSCLSSAGHQDPF